MDIGQFEKSAVLRDGTSVLIRAIRSDDKQRLLDAFYRLSRNSIYLRFFVPKKELTKEELIYFTEIDFLHHVALVAIINEKDHKRIIGVGRYIETDDSSVIRNAEFALTVDDEYQKLGMGTLLFEYLVDIARINGIQLLEADVFAENIQLQQLVKNRGFKVEHSIEYGIDHILFRI